MKKSGAMKRKEMQIIKRNDRLAWPALADPYFARQFIKYLETPSKDWKRLWEMKDTDHARLLNTCIQLINACDKLCRERFGTEKDHYAEEIWKECFPLFSIPEFVDIICEAREAFYGAPDHCWWNIRKAVLVEKGFVDRFEALLKSRMEAR